MGERRDEAEKALNLLKATRDHYALDENRTPGWEAIARRDVIRVVVHFYYGGKPRGADTTVTDAFMELMIKDFEEYVAHAGP